MNGAQTAAIAYLVGSLIPRIAVIGIGIGVGVSLARKHEDKRFVWWPVAVAVLLVAVSLPSFLEDPFGLDRNSGSAQAKPLGVNVQVRENPAPAGAVLLHLSAEKETALRNSLIGAVTAGLARAGQSSAGIVANIDYLGASEEKLITAVVRTNEGMVEAHLITLKDGKQFEIICIPDEGLRRAFPLATGECGAKVKEVLGAPYFALLAS